MHEARLTARRMLGVLPIVALVVGVNAIVDPARVVAFRHYEAQVAHILASGHHAADVANYDERLAQKLYAAESTRRADVLVLGSSRAMQVRETQFPGRTLYNASVSSAELQDDIALYHVFREHGWRPSLVVLQVDPWMLNGRGGQENASWAVRSDYKDACVALGIAGCDTGWRGVATLTRWGALFSPRYLQASLEALRNGRTAASPPWPTDDDRIASRVRRVDGSLSYERSYAAMAPRLRRQRIKDFTRTPQRPLRDFVEVDGLLLRQLETFVAAMQQRGARVVLLLSPYHPDAWASVIRPDRYPMVAASEVAFRQAAARTGAEVRGSFDPARCGCAESEFVDPVHPTESCMARLVAGL
jgi:hypothetical protein